MKTVAHRVRATDRNTALIGVRDPA